MILAEAGERATELHIWQRRRNNNCVIISLLCFLASDSYYEKQVVGIQNTK